MSAGAATGLRARLAGWVSAPVRTDAPSLRLDHRRLSLAPTGAGGIVALSALVCWLIGVNFENNLALITAYLLLALLAAAVPLTIRGLTGVEVTILEPDPVFTGDRLHFPVQLDPRKGTLRAPVLVSGEEGPATAVDETNRTGWVTAPTDRRGWMPAPPVTLSTTYPGGLFRASVVVHLSRQGLVYPRPERQGPPPPGDAGGAGLGQRLGDGDFAGLRGYRPGDPIRHLVWRPVARGEPPQTKVFGGAEREARWLDLATTSGPSLEARLSRLARWVMELSRRGEPIGLRLPGTSISPDTGPAHRHRCLEALAEYSG